MSSSTSDDVTRMMSYVKGLMQKHLAEVRQQLEFENTRLAQAQGSMADSQAAIKDLQTKEAELAAHIKANGWSEVEPSP
jgi:hypothetical protein